MALSTKTLLSTTASANNTSAVAATVDVPENAHTIIIFNPDGTNEVYVAEAAPSGSALSASTSKRIAAGKEFIMTIGTSSTRVQKFMNLAYSTSAGSINVNISYLCTNIV